MEATIIILQITNLCLSAFVPIISTFMGRITHSKCFSCLEIDRKLKSSKSIKNKNNGVENDIENIEV